LRLPWLRPWLRRLPRLRFPRLPRLRLRRLRLRLLLRILGYLPPLLSGPTVFNEHDPWPGSTMSARPIRVCFRALVRRAAGAHRQGSQDNPDMLARAVDQEIR
jgi:hypothetical protein